MARHASDDWDLKATKQILNFAGGEPHNRSIAYKKNIYFIGNKRQQGYIYSNKGRGLNKSNKAAKIEDAN